MKKKPTSHKRAFFTILSIIVLMYGAILAYDIATPPRASADDAGLLEACRQLCAEYGLVPTGHIRDDANAYLAATQTTKLTDALSAILADDSFRPVSTQPHSLVQQSAPHFSLHDSDNAPRSLTEWSGRPMVLVFYYGYGCSHCVAQLFAIDKDLPLFRELGAQVIALSADTPEHTRKRFGKYGAFDFPVLSDPENGVAAAYGVAEGERLDHGTFVINSDGKVVWAYQGGTPFLDNRTLLHVIAKTEGGQHDVQ